MEENFQWQFAGHFPTRNLYCFFTVPAAVATMQNLLKSFVQIGHQVR